MLTINLTATRPGNESPRLRRFVSAAWLCVLCTVWTPQAFGQHPHSAGHSTHTGAPAARTEQATPPGSPKQGLARAPRLKIPDTALLDQDGGRVRLYTDLIKGKVVVLNFFFTDCVNVCLTQGDTLRKLKARLGDRFGSEVFFVSVSRDPASDTPPELKRWAAVFGVSRGWTLTTGDKDEVGELVWKLTGEGPGRDSHSASLIILNDRTGAWTQVDAFSSLDSIIRVVDSIAGGQVVSER